MTKSSDRGGVTDVLPSWKHRVADIPERGLQVSRTACDQERAEIARLLELPACDALEADYRVVLIGGGRFRLTGELRASLTQSCIVTLEPVAAKVREELAEEFWPQDMIVDAPGEIGEQERDALSYELPEAIGDGMIDVGRVVYEQLATALDPYPRAADVAFSWTEPSAGEEAENTPFSVLRRLKGET